VHEQAIQAVCLHKWADYRPVLPAASVRFLARHDASVIAELAAGWFDDFDHEFREPVLTDVDGQLVTVCPHLMREIIDPEPPRIQRAFVEGAFMRRMFRLLVEGRGWEADAQVRDVMARHYPFHLVAVEAVESR
jgi:hypothetical protein